MVETAPALVADPTVYPVEETVGEDIVHRLIMEVLRPLLERFLAEQGRPWFVGADQFIYYEQHNPIARVSPDIYVLPNIAPGTPVSAWQVWETGVTPSFALEIASKDWEKDYVEVPERYAQLGIREWQERPREVGVKWQIWRRATVGFHRIEVSDADRVRSVELGAWLRMVGSGTSTRVRIAVGPKGDELFPTAEEAERRTKEAERQAKEAALQAEATERRAKEAALQAEATERRAKEAALQAEATERQAKEAALAELAELRARLAKQD